MGGVLDGQAVSAAVTNPAFLDANGDDTGIGRITLANTNPVSGPTVGSLQREHNSAASFMGKAIDSVYNDLPAWTTSVVGAGSDSLFDRADALTERFDGTTGHSHDGTAGEGPQITAANIDAVPLKGYIQQGTDILGVTGSSSDVSSSFSGKTPGGTSLVEGVVTSGTYNKVLITQASGVEEGDAFTDSLGNVVYGRLTESSGTWTLSYYVLLSGTETAYTFSVASDVRYYFQEIYNPLAGLAPVFSEFAMIPSDNVTADVITATTTEQGKVQLSASAPGAIAATGSAGTANASVANADHTHEGLHSIAKLGDPALLGDVTLSSAGAITITQTGQNIEIATNGAVGYQETPAGTANGVNTTFGPLSFVPSDGNSIIVFVDYVAVPQTDWSLVGNSIVFSSSIPALGQSVYVFYMTAGTPVTPPTPLGVFNCEYKTLTSGQISAGSLTLAAAPASASLTVVDLIGGGAQEFSVDFQVAGTTLSWSGLGLASVLVTGSKLRVQYFT